MELTLVSLAAITARCILAYLQSEGLNAQTQQAWTEWFAWGVIAIVAHLPRRQATLQLHIDDKEAQTVAAWSKPDISVPATIIAVLLAISNSISIYVPPRNLQWSLPLITIFAFTYLHVKGYAVAGSRPSSREPSPNRGMRALSPFRRRSSNLASTILVVGISSTACIALWPKSLSLDPTSILIGLAYACAAATSLAQTTIVSKAGSSTGGIKCDVEFRDIMKAVSIRVVGLTSLYLVATRTPTPLPSVAFAVTIFVTAAQLSSILYLSYSNTALAATASLTAAAALSSSLGASDPLLVGLYASVAAGGLSLVCIGLPRSGFTKFYLFALLLLPLIKSLYSTTSLSQTGGMDLAESSTRIHPIAELVRINNERFQKMSTTQSKTLGEAVSQYKERYGRLPPPGFDKWFVIAQEKEFQLIDEFDTIMESLEPYWGVPPATLQAHYVAMRKAPALVEFAVRNGKAEHMSDHYHAANLMRWMNHTTWGNILPDMNFMISTLDEPRVVAPFDTVDLALKNANAAKKTGPSGPSGPLRPNQDARHKAHRPGQHVKWVSVGRQNAWESMLSSCQVDSPARVEVVQTDASQQEDMFPFVGNISASLDVCASPNLLNGHGFLASPESLTITHSLVPIFAQCKPSIFNDILYPSPYYEMQMLSGDYDESKDSAFEEKLDRLYWAGTATGGYSTAQNWLQMHRQRLTMMTATDSTVSVNTLQRDSSGVWQKLQSKWADLAHLFYLKITNVVQCSDEACIAMRQKFGSADGTMTAEPKEAALGSKYALDMDGNTFSGRYYRLLKSNVAVLKHTIFKEWHDGRLIPWVHFIPVSSGAEELGEMMRYLTQEEERREIGRQIAEQGRDWARKTLRKEDLEIVFIRVLMEYGRVMNEERDSLGFDL